MRFATVALMASTSVLTLLSACSSAPKASTPMQAAASSAPASSATVPARTGAVPDTSMTASATGAQAGGAAGKTGSLSGSVYFPFDDSAVGGNATDVLKAQWQWLLEHPQASVTLQGNTDERGGAEYNLALGQRRADAVRQALVLLGAQGERIETVSFGKERPRAACHDENCWKDNRRVDTVSSASAQ